MITTAKRLSSTSTVSLSTSTQHPGPEQIAVPKKTPEEPEIPVAMAI